MRTDWRTLWPFGSLALPAVLLGVLAGCGSTALPSPPVQLAQAAIPPVPNLANAKFAAFLTDFRAEALAQGIQPATYDAAMAGLTPIIRVEQLNAEQPEFTRPVWAYLDSAVSERRVSNGRIRLNENLNVLVNAEQRTGVPKEIITAIWGIETDYGRDTGSFNLFGALATLGYDGGRTTFARTELVAALKILEQEKYAPSRMLSSWAGAFGQTQFLPSTFLKHAVDGDGDGRKDLWAAPDALASAGKYLADFGWARDRPWGYEIHLPAGFAYDQADVDITKSMADWRALGVRMIGGTDLPDATELTSIYLPSGARGPAFLVFPNFKVILKYNNAASYALAVSLLADRIKGTGMVAAAWPRDEQPLSRDDRFAIQNGLKQLGFDPGPIDGVIGRQVRAAMRAWQKASGIPADGYVNKDMANRLRGVIAASAPR